MLRPPQVVEVTGSPGQELYPNVEKSRVSGVPVSHSYSPSEFRVVPLIRKPYTNFASDAIICPSIQLTFYPAFNIKEKRPEHFANNGATICQNKSELAS